MSTERYFNVWLPDIGERVVMAPSAAAVKNYILDRLAEKELFSYGPASLKDVVSYLQSGENRLVDLMPTDKTAKVLPTKSLADSISDPKRGRGRPPKIAKQEPTVTVSHVTAETAETEDWNDADWEDEQDIESPIGQG